MVKCFEAVKRIMTRHPHITVVGAVLLLQGISQYVRTSGLYSKQYTGATPPLPKRFFPLPSHVVEYPLGQIQDVASLLQHTGSLFVMYYAPWCARSLAARAVFEDSANELSDTVQFVAVNCWYPQGACRQQNSFSSFPVLYFYHNGLDGWKYNGILRTKYIVQFALDMMHPITQVVTRDNLTAVLAQSDTSVIGYFDLRHLPESLPNFYQFFIAALRCIERDPLNVVHYVAITDPALASQLGLNAVTSVLMVRALNHSLSFPTLLLGYNSTLFLHWTFTNRQPPVIHQFSAQGSKSLQLSTHLRTGPTLVLFTGSLTAVNNDPVNRFHDAAMIYNSCPKTGTPGLHKGLYPDLITAKRQSTEKTDCNSIPLFKSKLFVSPSVRPVRQCCVSLRSSSDRLCQVCHNYEFSNPSSVRPCRFNVVSGLEDTMCVVSSCGRMVNSYNPTEFVSCVCTARDDNMVLGDQAAGGTTNGPIPQRSRFIDVLIEQMKTNSVVSRHCWGVAVSPSDLSVAASTQTTESVYADPVSGLSCATKAGLDLVESGNAEMNDDFGTAWSADVVNDNLKLNSRYEGLACRSNKTVSFVAMDWNESYMFAPLGVRSLNFQPSDEIEDRIVLINVQDESQYVMLGNLSITNILSFVENFTLGLLPRILQSVTPSSFTFTVPGKVVSDKTNQEQDTSASLDEINKSNVKSFVNDKQVKKDESAPRDEEERVFITEVTSNTFDQIVMDGNKDVMLLYYTPSCGFCASLSHVYLTVAQFFKSTDKLVFARLDGSKNDLPFEFTVSSYPTFIFFPAHRKENSLVYSPRLPRTVPALIRFVLRACTHSTLIETGLVRCTHTCMLNNLRTASRKIHHISSRIVNLAHFLIDAEFELVKTDFELLETHNKVTYDEKTDGNVEYDSFGHDESEMVVVLRRKLRGIKLRIAQLQHRQFLCEQQRDVARHMHRTLRLSVRTLWDSAERGATKQFIPRRIINALMRRHSLYLKQIQQHRTRFLVEES